MLYGIDIASWQAGIVPSQTPSDFVIVKATGGTGYVNPYWRQWADDVLASGKLLAFYHYAQERGCKGSASEEARFFVETVRDYIGKAVLILDWENDALSLPQEWALEWMDVVSAETRSTPVFYGYASNVNTSDYSKLAAKYPLWMASYLNKYIGCGFVEGPDNSWGFGNWSGMLMYQYTSQGRISGYDGNLDLSVFYGSASDWDRLCGKKAEQVPGEPENDEGLSYQVHVQDLGWLPEVHDGQVAGTTGAALRLECIKVNFPKGWEVDAIAHIQDLGWKRYTDVQDGAEIGTVGQSRRIESLGFIVKKKPQGKRLEYRVHQQYAGWKDWTQEGYPTGSDGQALRLEALRMAIR